VFGGHIKQLTLPYCVLCDKVLLSLTLPRKFTPDTRIPLTQETPSRYNQNQRDIFNLFLYRRKSFLKFA